MCCWQKPKPSYVAGAFKPSKWTANSFKVYRLCESLDSDPGSLLATTAKWPQRILA